MNVYHYIRGVAAPSAGNVGQAYIDTIIDPLRTRQPTTILRSKVEIQNLGDPFDFATITTSAKPGTRVGEPLTSFAAGTVQLNRVRTDMRNGSKRFVCGVETDVNGNIWEAAFLTLMQALADLLVTPIELTSAPGVAQGHLVVLKRFCTTSPSPPCLGVYRLPNTDTEIDNNNYQPTTATFVTKARSQVSRKVL